MVASFVLLFTCIQVCCNGTNYLIPMYIYTLYISLAFNDIYHILTLECVAFPDVPMLFLPINIVSLIQKCSEGFNYFLRLSTHKTSLFASCATGARTILYILMLLYSA